MKFTFLYFKVAYIAPLTNDGGWKLAQPIPCSEFRIPYSHNWIIVIYCDHIRLCAARFVTVSTWLDGLEVKNEYVTYCVFAIYACILPKILVIICQRWQYVLKVIIMQITCQTSRAPLKSASSVFGCRVRLRLMSIMNYVLSCHVRAVVLHLKILNRHEWSICSFHANAVQANL